MGLFSFNFNLGNYLEQRRLHKQQEKCQHVDFWTEQTEGGLTFRYQVLIESPAGTHAWICNRCGLQTTAFGAERVEREARRRVQEFLREQGIKGTWHQDEPRSTP